MQTMRTIEIDIDVHKRLEAERTNFSEAANDTLRRLLKISSPSNNVLDVPNPIGRSWSGKGIELPHGTELKMDYNGRKHTGTINNGVWFVEGNEFNSPSAAACGIAHTKDGASTSLNGWAYWHVKLPGQSRWSLIKNLKK